MKILCRLSERGNGWRASAGNPSTRPAYQADQTIPPPIILLQNNNTSKF